MFRKFDFDFDKKIIDIEEDYIDLAYEEQGNIVVINPNDKEISISLNCSDVISIEKEVKILPKCKTKIPFFVVDKNKSFKEKIFIQNKSDLYSVEVNFLKKENEHDLIIGDHKINNLAELYNLYLKDYELLQEKFFSLDFKNWLKVFDTQIFSLYNIFLEDTKEERVIENFFVATKMKEKAYVYFLEEEITFVEDVGVMVFDLPLAITDGFFEDDIIIDEGADFLTLEKSKIGTFDFVDKKSSIKIIIDFNKANTLREFTYINIGKERIKITLIRKRDVIYSVEKKLLRDGDSFKIYIENNSQKDIEFSFKSSLSYIRVPEKMVVRKKSKKSLEVAIAFTTMQRAFLRLNKTPYIMSDITCEYKVSRDIKSKTFSYKKLEQKVGQ